MRAIRPSVSKDSRSSAQTAPKMILFFLQQGLRHVLVPKPVKAPSTSAEATVPLHRLAEHLPQRPRDSRGAPPRLKAQDVHLVGRLSLRTAACNAHKCSFCKTGSKLVCLVAWNSTLSVFLGMATSATSFQASGLSVSHPPIRIRNQSYVQSNVGQLRQRTISTTPQSSPGCFFSPQHWPAHPANHSTRPKEAASLEPSLAVPAVEAVPIAGVGVSTQFRSSRASDDDFGF